MATPPPTSSPSPPSRPSAATLRQLRAFAAVAQDGSITRAAQRLHLTPSALSMLVSGLEGELGVRLFERTTRRLTLTDPGRELLPTVAAVFAQLDTAFDGLRQWSQRRDTRLAVAASPLLAATLVPSVMAGFRSQWPDVALTLRDPPVHEIAALVRSGEVDLGVCTADAQATDLSATLLYRDRLMLACQASHPLATLPEVTWADLLGEPLALVQRGSGLRPLVEQGFAELAGRLSPAYEVAQVGTAIGLVEAGLAVSVLPWYALASARAVGVCGVPLAAPVIERNIVALTAPERPLTEAGQAFLAHFRQHMASLATQPAAATPRRTRARSRG